MHDIKLKPISYSYDLKFGNDRERDGIYINCEYYELVFNFDDVNKEAIELYKKIKRITLCLEKKPTDYKQRLINSIEPQLHDPIMIGTIRTNVFSGYDVENASIDARIYIEENEFINIQKCVNDGVNISDIYLSVVNGLGNEEIEKVFTFSKINYLSKEWKISSKSNNILPIFGIEFKVTKTIDKEKDANDELINEENQREIKRGELKEDISEAINNSVIYNTMGLSLEIKSLIEKCFKRLNHIFNLLVILCLAYFFINFIK